MKASFFERVLDNRKKKRDEGCISYTKALVDQLKITLIWYCLVWEPIHNIIFFSCLEEWARGGKKNLTPQLRASQAECFSQHPSTSHPAADTMQVLNSTECECLKKGLCCNFMVLTFTPQHIKMMVSRRSSLQRAPVKFGGLRGPGGEWSPVKQKWAWTDPLEKCTFQQASDYDKVLSLSFYSLGGRW